ncbi:DUF309 domain-containing protein [Parathermosynechococcus lividus]
MHLSDPLQQAIAQFNSGQYYACHDTLEALWLEATEPDRTLYQGLLQLAVACYHASRSNCRGAILLLGEGTRRLQQCDPTHYGLDLKALIAAAMTLQAQLHAQAPPSIVLHIDRLN